MKKSRPAKILVVDDEPMLVDLLSTVLTRSGYCVLTASSVESALEDHLHEPIDLALIDYHLAGLSGAELLQRLSVLQPEARAILMSGDFGAPSNGFGAAPIPAADRCLSKPFSLDQLYAIVRRELGPPPRGDE